ncbi:MAG TPA: IS110 family transposase [Deltaproteobacteria bacterium]|nr:IS110 family transposase [Deltaproteobacteria bacterium]
MSQVFAGIDVSKDSFNYCIIDESMSTLTSGSLQMNKKGFESFKEVIDGYPDSVVALESTGSYHINLVSFLVSFKKEVCLVNPVLIKKFAQSVTLRKTKTDIIDAFVIAHFILKNREHIPYLILDVTDEIRALARIREDMAKDIARAKTRLKGHLTVTFPELVSRFNPFTRTMLAILRSFPTVEDIQRAKVAEIKAVMDGIPGRDTYISPESLKDLAFDSIGKGSPRYRMIILHDVEMLLFLMGKLEEITKVFTDEIEMTKKKEIDIIKSIKGIGDITASHFMAEIGDIGRFESKGSLIAYAGTDPSITYSGISIKRNGRISKRGSKSLRRCLYLMASGVMKFNRYFREYYLKKRQEGMQHRKAMIALCNKLLRVIYALLKKREYFCCPVH